MGQKEGGVADNTQRRGHLSSGRDNREDGVMLKGSVYCRRWVYQGKKRKAWGVRYSVNGKATRKIVAETRKGALAELERLKEDYKRRMLGVAEAIREQKEKG